MSLVYDNNGNLTDDRVLKYTYDGWNRLVKATRREDALTTVRPTPGTASRDA